MMWIRSSAVGLVIVLAAVVFESCERTKNKVETTLENKGQARVVFNTKNNTFGDVKQDEVVGINYRFINEGDAPLIINKIEKGSSNTNVETRAKKVEEAYKDAANAKPGSITAKANLVKAFDERNKKK